MWLLRKYEMCMLDSNTNFVQDSQNNSSKFEVELRVNLENYVNQAIQKRILALTLMMVRME